MSYIVTARKWRPQCFGDVIGQRHVTDTLQSAIRNGRVGHAYLFTGPRGVGKTTVARIFAKALNCAEGPTPEPCNTCDRCRDIQTGASLDVREMDGASNNSVDNVRDLITTVGYHASVCRYKLYIIDEVHMLSKEAFNALLKTLEEPPANVVFVFATTEPHKIPATILSRCQRYDFHRLSVHDITAKLARIAGAEGIAADESALVLIAQRAGGAMRDAESILEQIKSSRGDAITAADVSEVLGIADRDVYFQAVDCCRAQDVYGAVALFKRYYDDGGDVREFVEGLLGHLRDLLYTKYEGGIEHVLLAGEARDRLLTQAGGLDPRDIVRMIGMITEAETSLGIAVLPVLRVETALARMAMMEATIDLEDLVQSLGGAPSPAATPSGNTTTASQANRMPATPSTAAPQTSKPPRTPAPEPAPSPKPARDRVAEPILSSSPADPASEAEGKIPAVEPTLAGFTAAWDEIVAWIGDRKPHFAAPLGRARPAAFENGVLTLAFGAGNGFGARTVEGAVDTVGGLFGAILLQPVRVRCTVDAGEPAGDAGEKKKGEYDDLIAREPMIGDILERFGGEITDIWRD